MRVERHPILGGLPERKALTITVDGTPVQAWEGETVAAAMLAHRLRTCRRTAGSGEARGVFCGIGQCTDCVMQVDGTPNVRTCVTEVADGMVVVSQEGVGEWGGQGDGHKD